MTNVEQALQLLSNNKEILIALDRDGTLVAYADRPEEAIMPEPMRKIVNDLAALPGVRVAIVSARGIKRLKDDLFNDQIILAGNYGLEIRFANGKMEINSQAKRAAPLLEHVFVQLKQLTKQITGVILEDDVYSLCLHWHLVPEKERENLHSRLNSLKNQLDPCIYMRALPTSYEFMPNIEWDKSSALKKITQHLRLNAKNCLNLYIGDSQADEPAFVWANNHEGISIRVGVNSATKAQFLLPAPKNVAHFLQGLTARRSRCQS